MKSRYRNVVLILFALSTALLPAPASPVGFEITVDAAPNVLNIRSQSPVVTVHTDNRYETVPGSTVFLDGVAFVGTQEILVIDVKARKKD